MRHFLFIALLSSLSFLLHGYQYAVSDQAIFIPYINRYLNPSLYPGDLLFTQSSAQTSFFYPVMAQLSKFADIQYVFFAGYILFQVFFFHALHKLGTNLLGSKKLAYFSLFPFFLPKFISGTSIQTFDLYFGYRSIGIVFLLYFLSSLIQRRYYLSAIFASFGFWIHPLSIIPTVGLLPFVIGLRQKENIIKAVKSMLILFLLLLPYLLLNFSQSKNVLPFANLLDRQWYEVIRSRDRYVFPLRWNGIEWAALAFYVGMIVLFYKRLPKNSTPVVLVIAITGLSLFSVNFIMLEILRIPLFAQFQLVRSIVPIAYVSLIITPLFLTFKSPLLRISGVGIFLSVILNKFDLLVYFMVSFVLVYLALRNKLPWAYAHLSLKCSLCESILAYIHKLTHVVLRSHYKILTRVGVWNFGLLLGVFSLIYIFSHVSSFFPLNQKYQIPKPYNQWIDIQIWAKTNTDISERFMVLPRQIGFRVFSNRSIVVDIKDGAVVMYSPSFAKSWSEISYDLSKFYELSEADFSLLKSKYDFKYIVTTKTHVLRFPVAYINDYFVVYKLKD